MDEGIIRYVNVCLWILSQTAVEIVVHAKLRYRYLNIHSLQGNVFFFFEGGGGLHLVGNLHRYCQNTPENWIKLSLYNMFNSDAW